MNEFKPKPIKEIINTIKEQEEQELDGEIAFLRGETCPPSASEAFKKGYEKQKSASKKQEPK